MRRSFVLLTLGCASLNTAGWPDHCRKKYDDCLNLCPNPGTPAPGSMVKPLQIEVASCTQACNERSKQCK
jgi:hypothetical protein